MTQRQPRYTEHAENDIIETWLECSRGHFDTIPEPRWRPDAREPAK